MIRTSEKQEAAEATIESFKQHRGPFVVAAETTRMAMIFTDAKAPDNPIILPMIVFLLYPVTAAKKYWAKASMF